MSLEYEPSSGHAGASPPRGSVESMDCDGVTPFCEKNVLIGLTGKQEGLRGKCDRIKRNVRGK